VAELFGIGVREEMAAADEHVDGNRDFAAGRCRQQRRIVTDRKVHRGGARGPREEARDQLEFVHGRIIEAA
jgi:hypothetical protein